MKLADEEQGHGAGVGLADDAGLHSSAEVVRDQPQGPSRRRFLGCGIERHDQRGLPRAHVHLHGDRGADHRLQKRHDLLGERAQDHARVGGVVGLNELLERRGKTELSRAHRRGEQLLLRREVAQDRRGSDVETAGDVGEGGRGKPPLGERGPGGFEDLFAGNARRTAHA